MSEAILVLNCGSSSLKFALFDATRQPLWCGQVRGIASAGGVWSKPGAVPEALVLDDERPTHAALELVRRRVGAHPPVVRVPVAGAGRTPRRRGARPNAGRPSG